MNGIRTIGNAMTKLSKRQVLTLEIQALCVLTNNRGMNSEERKDLSETSNSHMHRIPMMVRMEHITCECFTKYIWN